jgi:predicted O-methyltransferase YrrM
MFQFPWGPVEYVSAGDLRGQFTEIFVQRHYAFQTSEPAPVIIDAGGNVGMSALWFKREHPKANLTVYEADPALAAVHRGVQASSPRDKRIAATELMAAPV